ncbi:hypothetical protein EUX98_g4513 [Antrodiella citrinella]|uniref:DNA 3'-5' helicase n=1 Tax=Antrodiella citrinella TaxID=2447956 RepID=A0A4S4MTR4_9APHY|nr:hypothetical protein EUX98_g4513 [Antrodiella citrinella]
MPPANVRDHRAAQALSKVNLARARLAKRGYDSSKVRKAMSKTFKQRSKGKVAREWQLDAAESILLGLDAVVLAGTGTGKTAAYMLPLLLPETAGKVLIVIEPLVALQRDQVRRFKKMGIPALAVNSKNWTEKKAKDIKDLKYRALFIRPEMAIEHAGGRSLIAHLGSIDKLVAVVVDEAHCISQWGGDFRPTYAKLSYMRAFLKPKIPVAMFSATLNPDALKQCEDSLIIEHDKAFYVNLGNDRQNIRIEVHYMNSKYDYEALGALLKLDSIVNVSDMPKTIIFTDDRRKAEDIWRLRPESGKTNTMARFTDGSLRFLVATEAVGMGADIPDIERIIQFGAPRSLTIWIQRAGRAGRLPHIHAVAYMLVEKSMFIVQQMRKNQDAPKKPAAPRDVEKDPDKDISEDDLEEGQMYKLKADNELRQWLKVRATCRRKYLDEFFNNPPRKDDMPKQDCCDNCAKRDRAIAQLVQNFDIHDDGLSADEPRLVLTPQRKRGRSASTSSSQFTNPISPLSDSVNTPKRHRIQEGQDKTRPLASMAGPKTRTGKHRVAAIDALMHWRYQLGVDPARYASSPFPIDTIISDSVVKSLAHHAQWKTVADVEKGLAGRWIFWEELAEEALEVLRNVDARKNVPGVSRLRQVLRIRSRHPILHLNYQEPKSFLPHLTIMVW